MESPTSTGKSANPADGKTKTQMAAGTIMMTKA
jgi:hypothetical protein